MTILTLGIIVGWAFLEKGKIPLEEEIIQEKEETTEKLLDRLTPEGVGSLTEEEKEAQAKLLEQLTPAEPRSMTEEEQKETGVLMEKLTP